MKKKLLVLLTLIAMISTMCISVSAADGKKVTVRIEGIEKTLYSDTVTTSVTTLEDLLKEIDTASDSISLTISGGYLTAVNSETAAKFGGWDGWLFTVNGVEPTVGMSSIEVKDGDSVVLYYGDPYGVGMQYPSADTSKIADGIITFTSEDATYDADYNKTVTTNPVKDANVKWYTGTEFVTYKTDANGQIEIEADKLTAGVHSFQIEKNSDAGLPLVLRLPQDTSVNVVKDLKLGDNGIIYTVILTLAAGAAITVLLRKRKANA